MDSLLTSPNGQTNGSTQEQSYENVRGRRITSATLPPGGGRKPFIGHIATFAQMFQAQFSKLYLNPDEAYRQSKKHASSMRRDPVVMEPLRARQLATALLDFQIQPEDENDPIQKKVCEELACIIRKTPDFLKLKMCLLEAIWFGRYAVNMYGYHWDENNVTNLVPGAWLPIHGDKLKFEHDTGNLGIMVGTQRTIGNIPEGCEWRLDTESKVIMVPNETYRRAMIVHKHEIEDGEFFEGESAGSIHGVGLRTRVYWPWFFKQKLLQWLMTFCERQALGITVWYYEAGNEQSEIQVRRAAEENNENLNIFFPRSVEGEQGAGIERLDVATGGAEMFKSVADEYWGDQIKRMIIGQTLTSQTGATGLGSEVAKQHRDTFENLIKYDSINLGETLTREMLIKPICEYGFPGMTWRPRLEFVIQPEDPKEVMEAAKMFIDMGGEASEDEIRELAGLRKPLDGEKVLGGSTAVPPGGPGGAPGLPPQLQGLGGEDGQPLDVPDGEYDLVPRGGDPEEFARKKAAKGQTAFEWNEADHPRDDEGKFAEKEGGGNKSSGKPKTGKSKGHVGFSGDFEYFKGAGGELYSAKKSEAIMPDGYRTGRWEAPPHLADKRIGMLTMDPDEPAEDDTPFALENTPGKPAPKEPEKPTPADQSHLFAGSDWKPGQNDLFDPDNADAAAPTIADPKPDETPREAAKIVTATMTDAEYAFARKSKIRNAGEDIAGSARHIRNAWRGLEQAEQDGTAEELVTRDNLLKNEPPNLLANVTPENALSSLAMHMALQKFPDKPPKGRYSDEEKKWIRENYVSAYMAIKAAAEQLQHEPLAQAIDKMKDVVTKQIKTLRGEGQPSPDYDPANPHALAQHALRTKFNPVANDLIDLQRNLIYSRKNDIKGKLGDFATRVKKAYGGFDSAGGGFTPEVMEKVAGHVQDVMEGHSFNKTFGTVEGKRSEFNAADMYVKHAERKGGREIAAAKTPDGATKHMLDTLKMRGVQWGNSVTDDERQHHLQKATEAFADLADVTGLPEEFLSANGKLGIAFGARGKGAASAHYEPAMVAINLTRKGGVGSLAHEWGHFFDHMLAGAQVFSGSSRGGGGDATYMSEDTEGVSFTGRQENGKWVTDKEDRRENPIWKAMSGVRKAWHASGFSQRLRDHVREMERNKDRLFKGRSYWLSGREVLARTFERYVQRKLHNSGRENTYLVGLIKAGNHVPDSPQDKFAKLWPSDSEADAMSPAFDALFAAIKDNPAAFEAIKKYMREMMERMEAERFEAGNWITIGANKSAPKGQKGGTPVMVKGGKIVKGPAALQQKSIGNLKGPAEDDRSKKKEQVDAKSYEHARRRKEARKLGIHPDDVQGVYDDLKAADDHETTLHNQLVRTAYKALGVDRRHKVLHGEDWASIPGADQVAREIANSEEYQFLLNARDEQDAAEKLYERMAEGIRQPKGDKELWDEALELAVHHQSTPARKEDDAVPFQRMTAAEIDAEAAKTESPSEAQKESGNYRKGHVRIHGMPITIEVARGQERSGKSKDGTEWSQTMAHHYGYIRLTESDADGEHLDVFIGPNPESEIVFVINQQTPGGRFDEHKCMIGFTNKADAVQGYHDCYSPGWKGFDGVTPMTIGEFKEWIESGDTGEPLRHEMSPAPTSASCPSCGGSESGPVEDDPDGHDTECVSCGHRYAAPVCDPDERGSECFQPERHSRSVTFEQFWPAQFAKEAKGQGHLFDESKVVRDEDGKFAEKGEGGPKPKVPTTQKEAVHRSSLVLGGGREFVPFTPEMEKLAKGVFEAGSRAEVEKLIGPEATERYYKWRIGGSTGPTSLIKAMRWKTYATKEEAAAAEPEKPKEPEKSPEPPKPSKQVAQMQSTMTTSARAKGNQVFRATGKHPHQLTLDEYLGVVDPDNAKYRQGGKPEQEHKEWVTAAIIYDPASIPEDALREYADTEPAVLNELRDRMERQTLKGKGTQ